jgi:hypothetical protein
VVSFTPHLQLETLFVLDHAGRIVSTREPNPTPGPAFSLIRGASGCAWAVHVDVPGALADELALLARDEPPVRVLSEPPRHADAYLALLGGRIDAGPVFTFPDRISVATGIGVITDLAPLEAHFRGWTADEIPERSPILGIVDGGHVVSVCFCARRTATAAEAGLDTAVNCRNRGLGTRVAAAWAVAIRDSGLLPLYSTSWENGPSLAVARKLQLSGCASDWNIYL